jgi:mono/diheme cytochrome c family protein
VKIQLLAVGLLTVAIVACSPEESTPKSSSATAGGQENTASAEPVSRWYAFQHVSQGARVFQENCAACHGKQAEGAPNWHQVGPDGKYPAPPLDGTGHGWHHPLRILFKVVKEGSPGGMGTMPAWGGKLSDDEIIAAIAWFQSKWPDQIYAAWMQREITSQSQNKG